MPKINSPADTHSMMMMTQAALISLLNFALTAQQSVTAVLITAQSVLSQLKIN